ncbi:MAG: hypothetical protein OXG09_01225 [Chloroflexi bacterium]|nr:hypothetical protein [Chloroflexota bacterium]
MILCDVREHTLPWKPAVAQRYLFGEDALMAWRRLTPGREAAQVPLILKSSAPLRWQLRQQVRAYDLAVDITLEETSAGGTRLRQEAWLELDGRRLKLLQPLLWRSLQRSARAALQPALNAVEALSLHEREDSHSSRTLAIA